MLKTKEEITDWLKKHEIKNYTVNDDLTVNVDAHVHLSYKNLKEIPIQFGVVNGNFSCSNNQLTTLKGSPHTVGCDFDCSNNKLKSLEGSPIEVLYDFYCDNNKLTSLEGAPEKLGGRFICHNNNLTSLKGSPQKMLKTKMEIKDWLKSIYVKDYTIHDDLTVDVAGDVNLSYKDLTEIPVQFGMVSGYFYCNDNKLTSLKGSPKEVGGDFYCQYNNLTSLEYLPKEVGKNIIFSPMKELTYLDEYKNNDGHIAINFNVLKKIIKSHKIKENLESKLIDKNVISKKFKI